MASTQQQTFRLTPDWLVWWFGRWGPNHQSKRGICRKASRLAGDILCNTQQNNLINLMACRWQRGDQGLPLEVTLSKAVCVHDKM